MANWEEKLDSMTDEALIHAMFSEDFTIAQAAKRIYDARHAGDPPVADPPHCSECFEGCPKCRN